MARKNIYKVLVGLMVITLVVGVCAYVQSSESTPPEGTWTCTAEWDHQEDGTTVPVVAEQEALCEDHLFSVTGTLSIGDAKWSEKKEGTCYASGDELYGTWTSVQTVAENDAARNFEKEKFEGKTLATISKEIESEYRVRVTSRSDTVFKAVNAEGRTVTCNRL